MNADEAKAKINAAAEKAKPKIDEISAKAKAAMSEVKANFKADEGTTGVKKVQSMFVNLWKSGMVGKGALVAAGVVVLLMVVPFFGGGGSGEYRPRNVPDGMLAVKGLYMRQPGDDALKACKAMVGSSKDLVVVDFRKGVPWDEASKAAAMKEYEAWVETAKSEVVLEKKYLERGERRQKMIKDGVATDVLEKKGYGFMTKDEFKEKFAKEIRPELADKKDVDEWLEKKKHFRPHDTLKIAEKPLIQIAVNEDGKREDKLQGLCNVWIDNEGNVKEAYFTEQGMARLFNAGDLSTEEFAQLLVNNYAEIPRLEADVQVEDPGRGTLKTYTWVHKDPCGFQVKLFERAYFGQNGQKYTSNMMKNDVEVNLALALVNKSPVRYFTVFAIKPESERKFD